MKNNHEFDEIIDVVVIGTGFAGLAAAIEARNAGASVCILEKMNACGGNSIISDGGIAAPDTVLQRQNGIIDSKELLYKDMFKAGQGLNHPDLVKTLVDNACQAFEWSEDYLGVEYLNKIDIFGGHSVFRCYTANGVTGATIIKKQLEKAEALGVEVRMRHHFRGFILNSDGDIEGIRVRAGYHYLDETQGVDLSIGIRNGVVMATGGFGSDVAFRMAQDPRLSEAVDTTNKPFATAEALKEALRIGAMPIHLSCIQLGPWASPDEKGYGVGPMFSEYIVFQYGIMINPIDGSRFVNELADRKTLSDKMLEIGSPCIGLADSKAVAVSGWSIEKGLEKNVVHRFESLTELAQHYALNTELLEQTVNRFNLCFEYKEDVAFGKPLLEKASPIDTPPFYGIRLWPKVHHTMGGLGINEKAQVIDLDGKVIKKLYAAGEVCGGVHGASRLGSCSITDCLVFGRIAGRNAALDVK